MNIRYTILFILLVTFFNFNDSSNNNKRRQKEILILPPSPKQTEHIRSNDDEIRKLANHIKYIKRDRQTINIIAITGSALVFLFNTILYIVLYRNRCQRNTQNEANNTTSRPYSKKTLQEKMSESTRQFLEDSSPRAWLFNFGKKTQKPPSPPSISEEDGFYDDQGRFIKHRPKTGDDHILPPIPICTHNIYQQPPNEDTVYINSKFLEHHINTRKNIKEKTDQKMTSRSLPKLPETIRTINYNYYFSTFEGYEVPVIDREDYKNLELPPEPANQTEYSGKARRQSSLSSQKYVIPYELPVRPKRVANRKDNQHENNTRAKGQLPATTNPYVFPDNNEQENDYSYMSLREESD